MEHLKIQFDTAEALKQYLKVVNAYNGDLDLGCGNQMVDGKSLMGILTLETNRPLTLYLRYGNPEELIGKLDFCLVGAQAV